MMRWLAAFAVMSWAIQAQAYDPRVEWKTLHTPVVRVHFPDGYYDQALAVARAAQVSWQELTQRLGYAPDAPIDMVLADETDSANGFAQVIPYNLVGLNAVAPEEVSELGDYDDWIYGLVAHEIAHIVHIDTVLGPPSLLNKIFGRWFFPNGAQPRWVTEGLATYFESSLTTKGRVGSAFFDMQLRVPILEGNPMGLDNVSGIPLRWPQGSTPYLYGSYFVNFIVQRYGEDTLRRVSHDYGARLVPYALNVSAERVTGQDYVQLYDAFLLALQKQFYKERDLVVSRGLRVGVQMTHRGQEIGPVRVSQDGTATYVETPRGSHTVLKQLDVQGNERVVTEVYTGAEVTVAQDGSVAYVTQNEVFSWYRVYGDIYRVMLATGHKERLTYGLRAHGPDLSADGKQLVFAELDGVHSVVRLANVNDPQGTAQTLADLGAQTQIWSPRFSPNGQQVAFAGFSHGKRDIFVVDVETKSLRRLTSDTYVDGAPTFSKDGEWVLFQSDRENIFNIYAVKLDGTLGPKRVTNVLGGAFRPELTTQGDALWYQSYGAQGFDLSRTTVGELALLDDAQPLTEEVLVLRSPPADTVYQVTHYSPWRTLYPRNWVPVVGYDDRGAHLGAATTGEDALGRHRYAVSFDYATKDQFIAFGAGYANLTFHPGFNLTLSRYAALYGVAGVVPKTSGVVEQDVWAGTVSTNIPLVLQRELSLTLVPSYSLEQRNTWRVFSDVPLRRSGRPDKGRFANVGLSLYFSNVLRFVDSISNERGVRLGVSVRAEGPWSGSEYQSVVGTVEAAGYWENPLAPRHVLAASATFGYGTSNYRARGLFSVGGATQRDVLLDLVNLRFSTGPALRGFPAVSFDGDSLASGSLEYRWPIWDIEQGVATLPFYMRNLSLAPFLDAAAVADKPRALGNNIHASVGAELRLTTLLGYALPVVARLGYGHGLLDDARYSGAYFLVGSTF